MPRGAPVGNQYAKKAQKRQGITISYYLRADLYEFLKECLKFELGDDSEEAVRKRVNELTEQALNEEFRRIFTLYKLSKEKQAPTESPQNVSPADSSVDR
jgi:hypothetical protein